MTGDKTKVNIEGKDIHAMPYALCDFINNKGGTFYEGMPKMSNKKSGFK